MKKLFLIIVLLSITIFPQELKKVADGFNFPEGPAWDGKGNLYLSSCYDGRIYRISEGKAEMFIDSASTQMRQTNGLTFGKDGSLYACDYKAGAVIRITHDKKVEIVAGEYEGKKFDRPNDLAFFQNGDLFFSVPKTDKPDGFLFKVNLKTNKITMLRDSLHYPNGMVFSKNWDELYLSESAKNRILKYKLDKEGNIISGETFIDLPDGEPDGLAFDVNGNLYAAHFGGGTVYVISPEGKILEEIKTPGKETSNVEFGGDDLKTLYITEDETNAVYSLQRETAGLKLIR